MNDTQPVKISNSAPKRRFEITISAGGDTREDALRLLCQFAEDINSGSNGAVSGGVSVGGYYEVTEDPVMTHERYVRELNEHLESGKGEQ